MNVGVRIALDAMGGDFGPAVVVPAAAMSLIRHPDASFVFFGDEAQIAVALSAHPALAEKSTIVHSEVAIAMDEKPSQALRHGRGKSSMWMALDAVRSGEAAAAVSAGNTGALMAMAMFCLRTLPGIERPAIAAIWPTVSSECIVLDVGANVGADATQLVDFAGMGAALARALFHVERPSVGLLNIGVEEIKGIEEVKRAGAALRNGNLPIRYHGFVEGDDVGQGAVDVVVTEGFSGNIALKTAEGTAKQIGEYLRAAMRRTLFARLGAFLAQGAFKALKNKMDPRQMNGGMFLGLNGIVIKSHGGADAIGFASAIDLAYDMAASKLVESIAKDVRTFQNALQNGEEKVA
ncbi:MAG: phosphate acyltransferase PlsX [Hyphomicrobiales bacterium]|nr:phosphate acyltransferase PlsX [Hyphomicrobiales bacterium]